MADVHPIHLPPREPTAEHIRDALEAAIIENGQALKRQWPSFYEALIDACKLEKPEKQKP